MEQFLESKNQFAKEQQVFQQRKDGLEDERQYIKELEKELFSEIENRCLVDSPKNNLIFSEKYNFLDGHSADKSKNGLEVDHIWVVQYIFKI